MRTMIPGFDRPTDLYNTERQDPPSARSTWIALALIVGTLVAVLFVLSIIGDFRVEGPGSTVAEVPAAQ